MPCVLSSNNWLLRLFGLHFAGVIDDVAGCSCIDVDVFESVYYQILSSFAYSVDFSLACVATGNVSAFVGLLLRI